MTAFFLHELSDISDMYVSRYLASNEERQILRLALQSRAGVLLATEP